MGKGLAAAGIVLVLALAGCGGDDSSDSSNAESDAQAAVAGFAAAFSDGDTESACGLLSDEAQSSVVSVVTRVAGGGEGDCATALRSVTDRTDAAALRQLSDFAEQIESGDVEDGSVSVTIAEDNGVVNISSGDAILPVPVQRVEDTWLIADANTLLFGVGKGD